MRFTKTIIPFLLASVATTAPVVKRSLISDITAISSDVSTLTSGVNAFTGGLFQALALLVDFDNLKTAIDTATTAANASTTLDPADSTSLTAVVTTLVPSILTVVSDLEAKVSVASNSGYTSDILSALNTLRNHSSLLFTAIVAIVDTADATTITTYQTEIYDALTTAIGEY